MKRFLWTSCVAICFLSISTAWQPRLWAQTTSPITVTETVPTIAWKDAKSFMGKEVFVVGKVVRTSKTRGGHVFLNFDADLRKTLSIFIKKDDYAKFPQPPEQTYKDKTVKVRGYIYDYNDTPSLNVAKPDAITILADNTPLPVTPAPAPKVVQPVAGDTITIGSYNVMNLFDDVDDPYTTDEDTKAKPQPELEALAKSIHGLNADVLALIEVENRGILQLFVNTFLSDMGYNDVVLYEGNDLRGIDVALLSRLPVGPVTSHRHLTFPDLHGKPMHYQRDLLRVRIEPSRQTSYTEDTADAFDVFVVHFKSRVGPTSKPNLDIREGEAKMTRAIFDHVLKENPNAPFVLCGDFNDYIDGEPLKTIIGTGSNAMTAFVSNLAPDEKVSYNLPPHLSMIDFILASPAMAKRYVPKSYHIITGGSPEKTGTDHNPVVAKFKMK